MGLVYLQVYYGSMLFCNSIISEKWNKWTHKQTQGQLNNDLLVLKQADEW